MNNVQKRLAALRAEPALHNDGRPAGATLEAAQSRLPPVSPEQLQRMGSVLMWRILIEPYAAPQRGLIASAPQVDEAERILSKVGRVLAMGSMAWKSKTQSGLDLAEEPHKPGIGDYVLHEMYAGTEVHLVTGHILRILTETECLMVLKDPSIIRGYL